MQVRGTLIFEKAISRQLTRFNYPSYVIDPTRYSIVQELVCTFDLPGGHYRKNDVLLKVIYRFTTSSVPPSPQFVQSRRLASVGRLANGSVSSVALSNPDSPAAPQSSEMNYGMVRTSSPQDFSIGFILQF